MIKNTALGLLICFTLALTACSGTGGQEPPAPTQQSTQTVRSMQQPAESADSATPIPTLQEAISPYPYPLPTQPRAVTTPVPYPSPENNAQTRPTDTALVIPSPDANTGVVVGELVSTNDGSPLNNKLVYLGKKMYLTPGPGYTYGIQENSSPQAWSSESGKFVISNIPPGQYILMLFTPHSATVVMQPNSDRELDVNVEAGKILDLGRLEAVPPG